MHDDDWAGWESEELAGLARRFGARRETRDGVSFWHFPPWLCPHCTPIGGPDSPVLPGCPYPLSRHGPMADGRAGAARGGES